MSLPVKEYAFDVKLWAVARVKATTEAEAREKLRSIDCVDLAYEHGDVRMTEASLQDVDGSELFEVDGIE